MKKFIIEYAKSESSGDFTLLPAFRNTNLPGTELLKRKGTKDSSGSSLRARLSTSENGYAAMSESQTPDAMEELGENGTLNATSASLLAEVLGDEANFNSAMDGASNSGVEDGDDAGSDSGSEDEDAMSIDGVEEKSEIYPNVETPLRPPDALTDTRATVL